MSAYEIVGPFDSYRVIVEGRRVPFLEARPVNGGRISLILDSRLAVDVAVTDAETVIPFIADCIAVGLGFACHPHAGEDPKPASPFPRSQGVDLVYGRTGSASELG